MNIKLPNKGVIAATRPKLLEKLKVNVKKSDIGNPKDVKKDKKDGQASSIKKQRDIKAKELSKIAKSNLSPEEKERKMKSIRAEINRLDSMMLKVKSRKLAVKKKVDIKL